jgi:hypothetical protein
MTCMVVMSTHNCEPLLPCVFSRASPSLNWLTRLSTSCMVSTLTNCLARCSLPSPSRNRRNSDSLCDETCLQCETDPPHCHVARTIARPRCSWMPLNTPSVACTCLTSSAAFGSPAPDNLPAWWVLLLYRPVQNCRQS